MSTSVFIAEKSTGTSSYLQRSNDVDLTAHGHPTPFTLRQVAPVAGVLASCHILRSAPHYRFVQALISIPLPKW